MDLPLRRKPYMAGVELTQEASLLLAIVIKWGCNIPTSELLPIEPLHC